MKRINLYTDQREETNTKYQTITMIPPSLLLKPAPTDLYAEREREDDKYYKYYEFYECRGFHNILVWNPWKLLEILGFTKDFTSEYWGFIANIEILEVNPIQCIKAPKALETKYRQF